VDTANAKPLSFELLRLIVHESDEWADNKRSAFARDSRKLVAERFSCSSGHNKQNIPAFGGSATDGFLIGSEGGKTEVPLKKAC